MHYCWAYIVYIVAHQGSYANRHVHCLRDQHGPLEEEQPAVALRPPETATPSPVAGRGAEERMRWFWDPPEGEVIGQREK